MRSHELAASRLVFVSQWIDAHNARRDPEAVLWSRVTKASEESGEAQKALRGALGENPRKGVTHDLSDVVDELLDTAVAALGAVEHIREHRGDALELLDLHIARVYGRAHEAGATP